VQHSLQDWDVEIKILLAGKRRALLLMEQGYNLQELLLAYILGPEVANRFVLPFLR
jgi:hypothetical protein